jgi:hypothetical protein
MPTKQHQPLLVRAKAIRASTIICFLFTKNLESLCYYLIFGIFTISSQEDSSDIVNHYHIAHDTFFCHELGDDAIFLTLVCTEMTSLVALARV